jgi:hypothetical protein
MSDTLAYGHYLTLGTYQFQNYWVNEDVSYGGTTYGYMPFAFSGSAFTKSGDNQPATLAFPNNTLSRGWASTAIKERWVATIRIMLLDPDNKSSGTMISQYTGQVVSGGWDSTTLKLNMASVFDAVGADVPRKKLTQQLVGHLPLTSNVRVQ